MPWLEASQAGGPWPPHLPFSLWVPQGQVFMGHGEPIVRTCRLLEPLLMLARSPILQVVRTLLANSVSGLVC